MNFRLLTKEELEPLRDDFIAFLASNGIDAQKWNEINDAENIHRRDQLFKQFSDLVWLKIFSNKKYMELKYEQYVYFFDFQERNYQIIRAELDESINPVNLSRQERQYELSREEDMYQWMSQGAIFSDGKNYKQAALLMVGNNE